MNEHTFFKLSSICVAIVIEPPVKWVKCHRTITGRNWNIFDSSISLLNWAKLLTLINWGILYIYTYTYIHIYVYIVYTYLQGICIKQRSKNPHKSPMGHHMYNTKQEYILQKLQAVEF